MQFDPNGALANGFNASHYDPHFDGSLRFKLIFRTNINNDIVTNADFTNIQFTSAFIASARFDQSGTYLMQTNYSSISFSIQNVNNESLIITPSTWADQSQIEQLPEGYYFIYVNGV